MKTARSLYREILNKSTLKGEELIIECMEAYHAQFTSQECYVEVKEAIEAFKWALDNMKPDRPELQSDVFNILTNAMVGLERLSIPETQKPVSEENTFEELFLKHQEFTRNTFPFATAKGSLIKLIEEANETINELTLTDYDGNALAIEYVDCMMCLVDSLQRSNIDFKQFKRYFEMKLGINLSRKWKQNKYGSYSHIK